MNRVGGKGGENSKYRLHGLLTLSLMPCTPRPGFTDIYFGFSTFVVLMAFLKSQKLLELSKQIFASVEYMGREWGQGA